jgi:hypothetical protein
MKHNHLNFNPMQLEQLRFQKTLSMLLRSSPSKHFNPTFSGKENLVTERRIHNSYNELQIVFSVKHV